MTAAKLSDKQYHEIFIPALDVYELGGPDVFLHLERTKAEGESNLAVVPISFIRALGDDRERYGVGGEEALSFLRSLDTTDAVFSDGVKVYHSSGGLDIAIVNRPEISCATPGETLSKLEETIKGIWSASQNVTPVLITNDPTLHIEFQGNHLKVEQPRFLLVNSDIVNEGIITGSDDLLARLYQSEEVPADVAAEMLGRDSLYINQFIRFPNGDRKGYVYARVCGDLERAVSGTRIVGVKNMRVMMLPQKDYEKVTRVGEHNMKTVLGITPKDMEQFLALQYGLFDPDVSLFFLCGGQGSGKTLLGYLAAVDQILWYNDDIAKKRGLPSGGQGFYRQIVLLKPNEIMGGSRRDVGFLPGSLYDKLKPHLQPFQDAHEESDLGYFSFDEMLRHPFYENEFGDIRSVDAVSRDDGDKGGKGGGKQRQYTLPQDTAAVQMTYSGFMRGRSFRDVLVVIDEAQNFTPYEIKTILSRLGEGCKAIIMGDPEQKDNPYCSREINGLTHAIRHYLGRPYVGLVKLTRNYRHQISDDTQGWNVFA